MTEMSTQAQSCLLLAPSVLNKEAEEAVQQHLTARRRGWGADACECQLLVVLPTSASVFEAQLINSKRASPSLCSWICRKFVLLFKCISTHSGLAGGRNNFSLRYLCKG